MKISQNILYQQAKRLWLKLLTEDFLILLLFVGLAFIFWWGRTMSTPKDITLNIPITYNSTSKQIVLTKELPEVINITIRDEGKQLHHINKQTLQLDVDYSSFLNAETGRIDISSEHLRSKIKDLLPGSTVIQHIHPDGITTGYYVQYEKTVPIKLVSSISVAPQHQLVGHAKLIPDSATIYGPKDELMLIEHIETDTICFSNLRDSICVTSQLAVPENISVNPASVSTIWYAEPFTEKTFIVPILTTNVPEGEHLRIFPNQIQVIVRVGVSHFKQIAESDIIATCEYPTSSCDALPIKIITNNPHITSTRVSQQAVEYIIER